MVTLGKDHIYPKQLSNFTLPIFLRILISIFEFPFLIFRNKAFTYPRRLDSESQNHVTSEHVGNALTCDFTRLPRSLVLDEITRYRSIDLYSAYDFCLNVHKIDLNSDQKMLNFCLRFAMGNCRSKHVRVVKLVRETMDGVQYLMDKNQHCQHKIRIVFLVRDPRPQLLSMARANKRILNSQRAADMSRKLCPRVLKDLRIARNFEKKHPGTLMFVRYEDLAEQPLAVTKRIYSFINESLHPNVTEWIDKNTAATNIKEEPQYETKRRNSSATASFWRSWIGRRPARTIDVECSEVYRHLGYKEIHTLEHLRNSSFALKHPWNWKIMRPK